MHALCLQLWAAAGYNCSGIPGTCSILHRHVVADRACRLRADQVAPQIPAKRGTVALSKNCMGSKGIQVDGWRRRACVNS
jgi:hypothetical protein